MEDAPPPPPKKSTTLSVDRAAFLLLRVKKAFKKKRQQRKEKQTQVASAALAPQSRSSRKVPPPLLRSRTLPAIIAPGIPVVSLHTERNLQLEERNASTKSASSGSGSHRWSLLTRHGPTTPGYSNNNNNMVCIKSLNLPKDDMGVYRRKSSGSNSASASMSGTPLSASQVADAALLMPTCDDFECSADGSVLLRIPAPHVVAARAYRLAAKKRSTSTHDTQPHPTITTTALAKTSDAAQQLAAADGSGQMLATGASGSGSGSGSGGSGSGGGGGGGSGSGSGGGSSVACSSGGTGGSTNTALTRRLAKLLHQSSMSASKLTTTASPHGDSGGLFAFGTTAEGTKDSIGVGDNCMDEAPRRLSWERRKDSSALQRSASIDSFAEIVWSDTPRPSLDIPRPSVVPFSKRPSASSLFSNCSTSSQNTQLNINYGAAELCSIGSSAGNSRRESLLSPSSTRRNKLTRIINDNILPHSLTLDNTIWRSEDAATTGSSSNNSGSGSGRAAVEHDDEDGADSAVILRNPSAHTKRTNKRNNNSTDINKLESNANENTRASAKQRHCTERAHTAVAQCSDSDTDSNSGDDDCAGDGDADADGGGSAFRWSEQLTQNVTTAKIRTAISCMAHDLKEMEFLLPQATTAASATTTPAMATTATVNHIAEKSCNLSVTRHARTAANPNSAPTSASVVLTNSSDQPNSKPASANAGSGKMQQNLAIYRHPANARAKFNGGGVGGGHCGNTPYRNKMSKKQFKLAQAQLDKLNQINLHLHALFSAVEHGHLDKARTILESTDVDVNSINSDGLSALDVAVLSNNRSMTKMLLQHGAIEGTQFTAENSIGNKLNGLLKDAESRIQDLSGSTEGFCQPTFTSRPSISSIIIGNTGSSVTGCTGNEIDKQIGIWERRVKGLRRLLLGWDQARPPDAPASVTVDVTGDSSIALQILEPFEGAIGTKFKVQWSTRADFSNVVGERDLVAWTSFHGNMGMQCQIGGLTQGRRYFIRATCGNVKGWGPFKNSVPASVVPSSWRDFNNREDRYVGRQRVLDNLFTAVRLARPSDVSELTLDATTAHRRNPKKKTTIKQLFSVASKFQKHLRRGIYLASIVYCEDKVLVTSEDFLPVIEIDETYPSTLHSDYHWLMKVACTWDDVKSLRTDMERNLTSAVHFRTKLLSAVCQMQSALGLTDLGQLYYKPMRDSHGTVVLSCIQAVKSQKTVSILNSRWLPVNKLQKKISALLEDYNINDVLISSIGDQIHYHHASMHRLGPGLYLGYLKMQCSVEQIQVVVPVKTPNVLPHCKVRENSHITAEEWQVLKRGAVAGGGSRSNSPLDLALEFNTNSEATTEMQRLFLYDLTNAAHKLFGYMGIKPADASTHRLYDVEVIEHSHDISFLMICPSVELTCAVPGQSELLLQRDDLASLSIQAFEMIHLRTYQPGIIQKYARLSCILELDTALANHSHREAFSTSELQTAKERLAKLHELTANLNAVWKSVRWLMDVIAFARDKNAQSSAAMKEILDFGNMSEELCGDSASSKQLLQLPARDVKFTKSSGRGSWPGPAATSQSNNSCLAAEHSKSEQNLGRSARTTTSTTSLMPPQQLPNKAKSSGSSAGGSGSSGAGCGTQQLLQVSNEYTSSDISLRKNSGDSMTSSQYTSRSFYSAADSALGSNNDLGQIFAIPPSRSDDTLALASLEALKQAQAATTHRKRTSSNINQHVTTPTSLATAHSSSSAPYLARDAASGSSLSLKNVCSSDYNMKSSKADSQACDAATVTISGKAKAASSANLRDGGLYLKSTLSALQTEIKAGSDELQPPALICTQAAQASKTSSTKSLSRQSSEEDTASGSSRTSDQVASSNAQASGIIHVYTAYNTGLASGTSLKLHVTPKTSAREVINLVVKQLNMAAVLKGNNGPIYTADMLDNFCLVAVIGARERCLRDDFKPLQLQNPWRKGRLYVRQKHELLAAIEHSNRKSHLI